MEEIIGKIKTPSIALFIGALLFSFYELSQIELVSQVSHYIIDNFIVLFIIISILTTIFFHFLEPKFRAVLTGNDTYWLHRLKLAGRILITFPGLILFYLVFTEALISFMNRNFGTQKELKVDGSIIDKYEFTSKGKTNFSLEIEDRKNKEPVSIHVDSDTYQKVKVGDTYELYVIVGSLGYMYKKK